MTCWVERGRTVLCNAQSRHSQAQSHAGERSIFESPDPWRVDGSIAAPKYAMGAHVVDLRCRCSFCLLPGLIISITRCEAAVAADEASIANRRGAERLHQATRERDGASPRTGLLTHHILGCGHGSKFPKPSASRTGWRPCVWWLESSGVPALDFDDALWDLLGA